MNESMIQGQIIRPFSPAIGKYKLLDDTITTLNNHIDEILTDENKIIQLSDFGNQKVLKISFGKKKHYIIKII